MTVYRRRIEPTMRGSGLLLLSFFAAACLGSCAGDVAGVPEAARPAAPKASGELLLTGELAAEDALRLTVPSVNIWPMTVRWVAEEGDEVAEGDTVVEFDNSQLAANLESLQSQVVTSSNSLSQARAQASSERAQAFFNLEQKKADWQKARLAAEMPKELASEQEWARLQLELETAALEMGKAEQAMAASDEASKAAIDIQRLALEKAQIALARAERGLEILNITAPRSGIVQVTENRQEDRPYRSGDTTWPGITIASLPNLDSLYVEASLFDVDDGRVESGAKVRASLDAFPDEILEGTVRSVAGFAQEEGRRSSRRSFKVQVDLEGIDPDRMRPGMSVKLEVLPDAEEGLVAPRQALGLDGDKVWLQLADGERVPVAVGTCDRLGCLVTGAESESVVEGLRLAEARSGSAAEGDNA